MPRLEIVVTAEDIALGVRSDTTACPIARAAGRLFGEEYFVSVDGEQLDLEPLERVDEALMVDLPDAAVEFITRFDRGSDVEPKTFAVEVPAEVVETLHIPPPVAPGQVEAGLV